MLETNTDHAFSTQTMPDKQTNDHPGWEKRGVYNEPRLSELKTLYEEIGYEVLVLPYAVEDENGCVACLQEPCEQYRRLYTRKR